MSDFSLSDLSDRYIMPYLCDKIMISKCFFKKNIQQKMSAKNENIIFICENTISTVVLYNQI